MSKLTLSNVTNLSNPHSSTLTINNNSDAIEIALENTLSRDGTGPNQMGADLDMDSNNILNLPVPVADTNPVRLLELNDAVSTLNATINNLELSGGGVSQLSHLTDVTLSSPGNTQLLEFNGSKWVNQAVENLAGNVPAPVINTQKILDRFPQNALNLKDFYPLVGDGSTDNLSALTSFSYTDSFPKRINVGAGTLKSVTISIASPAVITCTAHNLRVNDAIVFSTTGSLPTGITAGTVYYVLTAGITLDTFRISTKNAFTEAFDGEGTAVITTGSQSGVHSIITRGVEWQNYLIPPGHYYTSQNVNLCGNGRRQRFSGYGAAFNAVAFGSFGLSTSFTWTDRGTVQAYINSTVPGVSTVTLTTLADASKFYVGCWVCLMALDLQQSFGTQSSTPNNTHYFEFNKITAINAGTGVVTLQYPLKNSYKSTYPEFWDGSSGTGFTRESGGGKATMFYLNPDWDAEREIYGIRYTSSVGAGLSGSIRRIKFVDCVFDADGAIPSVNQSFIAENCVWGAEDPNLRIEVDKLVEEARFINCTATNLVVQSAGVNNLTVDGGRYDSMQGTARNTTIRNCNLKSVTLGPLAFGASDCATLENCYIESIDESPRLDAQLAVSAAKFQNCTSNYTFSNGTLKIPMASATAAHSWAVPGRKMYVNDMNEAHLNMGSPFIITDVYQSASDFCMDTTLSALPVGNSTNATVTMTIASPAVVTWTAHGLTAGTPIRFKTTGTLPTGVSASVLYYVLATGLATDTFRFSTSVGGSAVNTTGSQSGTHTGVSNPLHFQPQSVGRMNVKNCTGCMDIVNMSNAPDGLPPFSYFKHTLIGYVDTSSSFWNSPKIYGNISNFSINVIRPYTGSGALTLTLTANGFDSSLLASNLSQVINLKTAGKRTITTAAATGSQTGDTIAAYAGWISDTLNVVYSSTPSEAFDKMPIVEIEMLTDQGYTKSSVILIAGPNDAHATYLSDTTKGI